jgi:hypothetical protein
MGVNQRETKNQNAIVSPVMPVRPPARMPVADSAARTDKPSPINFAHLFFDMHRSFVKAQDGSSPWTRTANMAQDGMV